MIAEASGGIAWSNAAVLIAFFLMMAFIVWCIHDD